MASRTWNSRFLDWLGHPLPASYLAFDCETNGLQNDWSLPVDMGFCLVRNRRVVKQGDQVLNWVGYPGVDADWLEATLKRTAAAMKRQGKPYRYTMDFLRRHGHSPERVLYFYWRIFRKTRKRGYKFIGHNAWHFDSKLVSNILREACGLRWVFGPGELYDTGGMEKALLAGDLAPREDEYTLQDYFRRVHAARRRGVRWSIEHCVARYDLCRRFGLQERDLHGAGADAYVSHLLFEEHRKLP